MSLWILDTYIGSVEKHTQTLWILDANAELVHRPISYFPGLYKIFDEILVNAADNKQRDPNMDWLKVVIDVDRNLISVFNNGDGIPVEVHKEEGIYVPEMIFGHLLTSSNYDDDVKKTTGGRNGFGAKLTNIFSTVFTIETADGRRQKKYKQMAGISVVGRNHYGVFPLRDKLLNVREASKDQVTKNVEIQHIKKILGLQQVKQYDSVKSLRYGHLMIMTDHVINSSLVSFFPS